MLRKSLLLTLVLFLCGCAEEPVRLALQLEPGREDAYSYSYEQRFTVAGEDGAPGTDLRTTLSYGWRERALDISPSTTEIELTFDSVVYEIEAESDGELRFSDSFDSNDSEANPSLTVRGYAGMVGRGFTLQLDPLGERIDLVGYDEMLEALIGELYNPNDMRQAVASQSFARDASAQAMADSLTPLFSIYPAAPVRVGDKWTRRAELTTGFPRGMESQFELIERRESQCRVKVHAFIAPLEDAPITHFGASAARTRLRGEADGEFTLDEITGRILVGRLEAKLEGTLESLPTEQREESTSAIELVTILEVRRE